MNRALFLPLLALAAVLPPAAAHVVLDRDQAPAGSYHKAVLRVGHGCDGSPTVRLRVAIADGIGSVKPQPKPGWTVTLTRLAAPEAPASGAAGHHHPAQAGRVTEVVWSGGPLADDHFDEFALLLKLPASPGTTLYLPVIQECKDGMQLWTEVPQAGQRPADLKSPAPALRLVPAPAS